MKSWRYIISLTLLGCLVLNFGLVADAAAPKSPKDCPADTVFDSSFNPAICRTPISSGNLPTPKANDNAIQTILSIVLGVVGALALLMITVSGLRYVTSAGNPEKATKARDGIIFSLVGLALAIFGEALVAFVVRRL